jgi:RNA polymerase sigma-70 factor (family 1)
VPALLKYTDEEIFDSFRSSTGEGFSVIFTQWYRPIYHYAFSLLKNKQEAEDVTDDCFMKLWERRRQFTSLARCKSYLFSSVRNTSFNLLRRRKVVSSNEEELTYLHSPQYTVSFDEFSNAQKSKKLYEAMESLPSACRKICEMIYTQGKNSREVAEELKLSVSTVKTQKQRALSYLRKKLATFSMVSLLLSIFFTLVVYLTIHGVFIKV